MGFSRNISLLALLLFLLGSCSAPAPDDTPKPVSATQQSDDHHRTARYLGNAGVMVQDGDTKLLFDPLFEKNFETYQLVPPRIKGALMLGSAPYDDIDVLFISHAHDDHFAADTVLAYLQTFPQVKLVAPKQAVDKLLAAGLSDTAQVFSIDQSPSDLPVLIQAGDIFIEAVTIPHSGGERFAEVRNTVYRVQVAKDLRVLHLGDATIETEPFAVHKVFWGRQINNLVFTPYWLYKNRQRRAALDLYVRPERAIAIHVPTALSDLKNRYGTALDGVDMFTRPGEIRVLDTSPSAGQ